MIAMKIMRPQIKDDDNFLSKIIKYIPAEVIAVYTAIIGILKQDLNSKLPTESAVNTYFWVLCVIIFLTPVWTYIAVIDNPDTKEPPSKTKRAIFHAIIATISFIIWVYAIGDPLFKSWLTNCYSDIKLNCTPDKYNSVLGSIILILYTGLIVPLLERIILGKPNQTFEIRTATPQQIIASCEANYEKNKSNCSAFVIAVASNFSVNLTGQADDIVDQIMGAGWTQLEHDGVKAKEKADNGWLVVAGLKSSANIPPQKNGHVAIIVSGGLAHQKYPTGYWGKLDDPANAGKNKTINFAWNKDSRDQVFYAARKV
nr:hypothetical protein [Flavobacterium sp. ASV13]